jgi:methionine sulfoxide reductase heme-binding subunit
VARDRRIVAAKAVVWILCLTPAARLAADAAGGRLGPNPVEEVLLRTGWWTLVLLLASLAVTPLRRLTGRVRLIRFRRLLGLFAFGYATMHFLGYVALDQWFAWEFIVEDIAKRPFILVGFTAWCLLLPLAVTSTRGWIRRLGRGWGLLHRLVYVAACLGALHFYWKVKADTREPLVFAAILGVLLLARLPVVRQSLGRARRGGGTAGRRDAHAAGRTDEIASAPGS